uniref:DNA mismatch repair proteins mutS family domain-containing protein n=1 Tax=Sinocyclocheilus grahami TaxID=75366 RepID=A0A672KBF7_SINGR
MQSSLSLNHSTGDSLVLVDEFGKGTNTVDGLALLTASLNNWMRRGPQCPHLLMSTCFHSLIQLGLISDSPLLDLLTLETAIEGEELVFLYQVKNGICQSSCAANIATLMLSFIRKFILTFPFRKHKFFFKCFFLVLFV